MPFRRLAVSCAALLLPFPAATPASPSPSDYAGMETREIKSLSAADIEQLRAGHGWGLSLAAELNGVPGPRHLLELKEELGLSADQVAAIETLFARMKEAAVPLGEDLIRLEREMDRGFADGTLDAERLDTLLESIAGTRKELRKAHLLAHLETPALLTREQIEEYSRLRGYGEDACRAVPPGHDAAMWREHNGCD